MSGWRGRALDMKDTPKWACPSCLVEGNGDLMWQEGISPLSHQNGKVLTQGRVIPLVLLKVSMRKEGQALGRTSPLTRISSEGMVWKGPRRGRLCRINRDSMQEEGSSLITLKCAVLGYVMLPLFLACVLQLSN